MLMKQIREGFTLVELALAMAFVGVLSISIVLIISNTVAAYQRGMTLTRVNSVGTDLANDMRISINNSSARAIADICTASIFKKGVNGDEYESLSSTDATACKEENAFKYIYVVKNKDIGSDKTIPIYGAFCTGEYSYMWNSGYFVQGNGVDLGGESWIKFSYYDDEGTQVNHTDFFRLIKVKDSSCSVCVAMRNTNNKRYSDDITNMVDLTKIGSGRIEGSGPIDLLPNDGGNSLAFYDLFVSPPAASMENDNLFYSVSFVLGTTTGGADILAKGNSCAAPQDLALGSSNYCAINKFNLAMQVNGGK